MVQIPTLFAFALGKYFLTSRFVHYIYIYIYIYKSPNKGNAEYVNIPIIIYLVGLFCGIMQTMGDRCAQLLKAEFPNIDEDLFNYVHSVIETSGEEFENEHEVFDAVGAVLQEVDPSKSEDSVKVSVFNSTSDYCMGITAFNDIDQHCIIFCRNYVAN